MSDSGEDPSDAPPHEGALTRSVQAAIEWAFQKAFDGLPGELDAVSLAEKYRKEYKGDCESAIRNFVTWQVGKAVTVGFVSNVGGLITLPVAVPANIAGSMFINLRLIAVIACLRGYDIRDDRLKTFAIACLAGESVFDLFKDAGILLGTKLTQQALKQVSGAVLIRINKVVGFRLVTKAGSTGVVNLSRAIPFVGGLIGGGMETFATRTVSDVARRVFPPLNDQNAAPDDFNQPPPTDSEETASAEAI